MANQGTSAVSYMDLVTYKEMPWTVQKSMISEARIKKKQRTKKISYLVLTDAAMGIDMPH